MSVSRIPIELDPKEIRHTEGRVESVWVPGSTVEKFQYWTRFYARRDAKLQQYLDVSSLPITTYRCIQDKQTGFKVFRKRSPVKTHSEEFAPLGKDNELVEVGMCSIQRLKAVLVWSEDTELDKEFVTELFPEHVKIERQGTAWVVYEVMEDVLDRKIRLLREEEIREEAKWEERVLRTKDIASGEEVRTLPFTNVSMETGLRIQDGLDEALAATMKEGGTKDIREFVQLCSTRGPIRDFSKLFTTEQREAFRNADEDLIRLALEQFVRQGRVPQVNKILASTDEVFEQQVAPYCADIANPFARASVERTLQTWRNNRLNPARNAHLRTERYATPTNRNRGIEFPVPTFLQHPDYFSIQTLDQPWLVDRVNAGYEVTTGLMYLKPPKRSNSFLFGLDAMHETTHKNQHADMLGSGGDPEANQERGTRHIVSQTENISLGVLEEECEAWSNMIELLGARVGDGDHNVPQSLEKVGISDPTIEEINNMNTIVRLAILYYEGGGRQANDVYPSAFADEIIDIYLRNNNKLYILDSEGFPIPYEA